MAEFNRIGLTVGLALCLGMAMAQTDPRDAQYSPPAGSPFDQKSQQTAGSNSGVRSALLFHPLYLIRGAAAVGYYRQLGSSPVSFNFTTGLVFGKDAIAGMDFAEITPDNGEGDYSRSGMLQDFDLASGKRHFLQFGFRIVTSNEDNLEGVSIELAMRLHRFRMKSGPASYIEEGIIDFKTSTFLLGYAYLWSSGTKSRRFCHSLSYGVGYRSMKYTGLFYNDDKEEISDPDYVLGSEITSNGFILYVNYSLGLGW